MLIDSHGRKINYLRLAVTDRCNLRCFYCMPEQGNDWLSRKELMSYAEMLRISSLLVKMGIEKIRITGGEPFVRKDIMQFLASLSALPGLQQISLTTNGILTAPLVPDLKKLGISSINLSVDTLDQNRFFAITRRDELPRVLDTLDTLLRYDMDVKINAVVMEGKNTQDILPLVELTRDLPVSVRFIEEMPFNGGGNDFSGLAWDHFKILETIKEKYPNLQKLPDPANATAYNYGIAGHKGTVGIIAAYTRSFCGTCNRIRLTPQGSVHTCLYGGGVLNVKDLMRSGYGEPELEAALTDAILKKEKDGWGAEKVAATGQHASMATIGG
ncbi:GTP 3',8-cyclase MoaA [Rufibacter roseus]|uniref:GTP 3',8-cyclase n=1 Tax=Rufibacter roseus TaxID=1567108 RepID=A0ABW2DJX0_9BACT|nr:GTP 3',8-cyclase MoaA [Rufibacter roseus]